MKSIFIVLIIATAAFAGIGEQQESGSDLNCNTIYDLSRQAGKEDVFDAGETPGEQGDGSGIRI
ncbi:MAG: hypothetical protein HQK50_15005 [Oligoflexia bacterium]|nr:hypothetical protein [Oligoflexia bacterium]MBF0366881.1 hypothetical protein [Oligoflexia bacterium]